MIRGFLRKTPAGIAADLSDTAGYRYALTGSPAVEGSVRGYWLEIEVTAVPEWLKLPLIGKPPHA